MGQIPFLCRYEPGLVSYEYVFDGLIERGGDLEGKRKRRVVLACFDRVDALPGHVEFLREPGLRPVPLGAENPQTILHE